MGRDPYGLRRLFREEPACNRCIKRHYEATRLEREEELSVLPGNGDPLQVPAPNCELIYAQQFCAAPPPRPVRSVIKNF